MAKQISLASKLDTASTAALRDEVLSAQEQDLVFDASQVEQIGGLTLELLISVGTLWRKAGHSVTLNNPSEKLVDDLKRLGLTPDTLLEFEA
ncbi:MAG: STAS domain-containing protein [Pseudomonadota bacterium]